MLRILKPKLKYLIVRIKSDGIYNNKSLQTFINNLILRGSKAFAEKLLYSNILLLNSILLFNSRYFFYLSVRSTFLQSKLVFKRVRKKIQQIPLLLSFFSNIKTAIKFLIRAVSSSLQNKFNKFIFNLAIEFSQIFSNKGFIYKNYLKQNKLIFLNKKYIHFRW